MRIHNETDAETGWDLNEMLDFSDGMPVCTIFDDLWAVNLIPYRFLEEVISKFIRNPIQLLADIDAFRGIRYAD